MGPRTGHGGVTLGELLSGLGAMVVMVSLWRPWYELRFPDELLQQARAFSSRMGELGPYTQQGIDELQSRGSVPVTAWQAFEQADTVLAVAAGVVLGLVLLNAIGALSARLDGALVLAGLVATGLVAFRLVSPPGPDAALAADLLHPASGLFMALVGALLMTGGGIMALSGGATSTAPPAPTGTPLPAHQVRLWDAS